MAQFISPVPALERTPYLPQEGHCWDQHLPLPLAEPEQVLGLPRHSKEQDPPQGSPSAGAALHVWKLELPNLAKTNAVYLTSLEIF